MDSIQKHVPSASPLGDDAYAGPSPGATSVAADGTHNRNKNNSSHEFNSNNNDNYYANMYYSNRADSNSSSVNNHNAMSLVDADTTRPPSSTARSSGVSASGSVGGLHTGGNKGQYHHYEQEQQQQNQNQKQSSRRAGPSSSAPSPRSNNGKGNHHHNGRGIHSGGDDDDEEGDDDGYDKDAHIMDLILQKHEQHKRISELEGVVAQLQEQLASTRSFSGGAAGSARGHNGVPPPLYPLSSGASAAAADGGASSSRVSATAPALAAASSSIGGGSASGTTSYSRYQDVQTRAAAEVAPPRPTSAPAAAETFGTPPGRSGTSSAHTGEHRSHSLNSNVQKVSPHDGREAGHQGKQPLSAADKALDAIRASAAEQVWRQRRQLEEEAEEEQRRQRQAAPTTAGEEEEDKSATDNSHNSNKRSDTDDFRFAGALAVAGARAYTAAGAEGDAASVGWRGSAEELYAWNGELIKMLERAETQMLAVATDARQQLAVLNGEVAALTEENSRIRAENDSLKGRISDDVLQRRLAYRSEMAGERAAIATRVRRAGQRRLEALEGSLMEAHDDLYHVQRWDAAVAPVRAVCFVFHYVSNLTFPLAGAEEAVMNAYQQALVQAMYKHSGYRAATYRGMEVYAFQGPLQALHFCRDTHEQLVRMQWPERAQEVAHFKTIAEYGNILFRGPRVHTCLYACSPEAEVDPSTGRVLYYGPEMRDAVTAAVRLSPPGEIVVNAEWGALLCRQARRETGGREPSRADVVGVRDLLGRNWSVVGLSGAMGIMASVLPTSLVGRRGVQPYTLRPTPATPWVELDVESFTGALLKALKGVQTDSHGAKKKLVRFLPDGGGGGGAGNGIAGAGGAMGGAMDGGWRPGGYLGGVGGPGMGGGGGGGGAEGDNAALAYYALQQDTRKLTELYKRAEEIASVWERYMMTAEDRLESSKRKPLDPSETVYVCTVDVGDQDLWRRLVPPSTTASEYHAVRSTLQSHVHAPAKNLYGFLMNGNGTDIFTYVFREVEQALAFVSEVYINVNRFGTKVSRVDHMLLRAGISEGTMSTIYRNVENGILKCTGPVIRLSGTLCDLAQSGEILAMEDVISAFYAKNENLLDRQYNIVAQKGQFLSGFNAPAVVHSILPKPFAFRRRQLMAAASGGRHATRSATAALMVHTRQFPREAVDALLEQALLRQQRIEAGRMLAEDTFERRPQLQMREAGAAAVTAAQEEALCNPWMLTTQGDCRTQQEIDAFNEAAERAAAATYGRGVSHSVTSNSGGGGGGPGKVPPSLPPPPSLRVPNTPLCFMFIDVAAAANIQRDLPKAMAKEVWGHYHYLVQRAIRDGGGYVCKTNGLAGYLVVFTDGAAALDAAVAIQLQTVGTRWPSELRTLESTLLVKDTRNGGGVLFAGPRPIIAIHYSTDYGTRMTVGATAAPPAADGSNNGASPLVDGAFPGTAALPNGGTDGGYDGNPYFPAGNPYHSPWYGDHSNKDGGNINNYNAWPGGNNDYYSRNNYSSGHNNGSNPFGNDSNGGGGGLGGNMLNYMNSANNNGMNNNNFLCNYVGGVFSPPPLVYPKVGMSRAELYGPALSQLLALAAATNGGEIKLSTGFVAHVGDTPAGKSALLQLQLEIVPLPIPPSAASHSPSSTSAAASPNGGGGDAASSPFTGGLNASVSGTGGGVDAGMSLSSFGLNITGNNNTSGIHGARNRSGSLPSGKIGGAGGEDNKHNTSNSNNNSNAAGGDGRAHPGAPGFATECVSAVPRSLEGRLQWWGATRVGGSGGGGLGNSASEGSVGRGGGTDSKGNNAGNEEETESKANKAGKDANATKGDGADGKEKDKAGKNAARTDGEENDSAAATARHALRVPLALPSYGAFTFWALPSDHPASPDRLRNGSGNTNNNNNNNNNNNGNTEEDAGAAAAPPPPPPPPPVVELPRAQVGLWERQARLLQALAGANGGRSSGGGSNADDGSAAAAAAAAEAMAAIMEAAHPEAVEIQAVLQQLLGLFPTNFSASAAYAASTAAAAATAGSSSPGSAALPATGKSGGGAKKKKTKGGAAAAAAAGASAGGSSPAPSALEAAAAQAEEEEEMRYETFLKTAKTIVTFLVNAFTVINERKKPPALPKDSAGVLEKGIALLAGAASVAGSSSANDNGNNSSNNNNNASGSANKSFLGAVFSGAIHNANLMNNNNNNSSSGDGSAASTAGTLPAIPAVPKPPGRMSLLPPPPPPPRVPGRPNPQTDSNNNNNTMNSNSNVTLHNDSMNTHFNSTNNNSSHAPNNSLTVVPVLEGLFAKRGKYSREPSVAATEYMVEGAKYMLLKSVLAVHEDNLNVIQRSIKASAAAAATAANSNSGGGRMDGTGSLNENSSVNSHSMSNNSASSRAVAAATNVRHHEGASHKSPTLPYPQQQQHGGSSKNALRFPPFAPPLNTSSSGNSNNNSGGADDNNNRSGSGTLLRGNNSASAEGYDQLFRSTPVPAPPSIPQFYAKRQ